MNLDKQTKLFDVVVCHGGAGIVNDCIKNGVPMFIIANFVDQPLWLKLVR